MRMPKTRLPLGGAGSTVQNVQDEAMARRLRNATLGVEEARRRLPQLLADAHRGEVTIITKHGRPYAALVPVEEIRPARPVSVLSLRGSGKGLWGDVAAHVERMRREWR